MSSSILLSFQDVDVLEECPEGKVPEELLGVVPITGIMTYLVKWKPVQKDEEEEGTTEPEEPDMCLVKGEVFKKLFPDVVIAFYEKNISWLRDTRNDEDRADDLTEQVMHSQERKMDKFKELKAAKKHAEDMNMDSSESDSDSVTDDKQYEVDTAAAADMEED